MRIAVDTRLWQTKKYSPFENFIEEVFQRLITQHQEHHFIFIFDSLFTTTLSFPPNTTTIILSPKPKNILSHKWWYDVKLPAVLKKHKADVFIGSYGLLSLQAAVSQMLVVQDLSFLFKALWFTQTGLSFYRKYTKKFVAKAKTIVAVSGSIKQQLIEAFKADESKIQVINKATSHSYCPIEWHRKEAIKQELTNGCEYFVFNGELSQRTNIFNLLKAFSIFKKWQKTNMKLVLCGGIAPSFEKELKKLETYKYRDEVILKHDLSPQETTSIVASAYAFVYPVFYEGFAAPALNAMQCEVPVITSSGIGMDQTIKDAALYANPENPEEIAGQMKRIFKDEQLRNKLIEDGKKQASLFNWDEAAKLMWQQIEKTISS